MVAQEGEQEGGLLDGVAGSGSRGDTEVEEGCESMGASVVALSGAYLKGGLQFVVLDTVFHTHL